MSSFDPQNEDLLDEWQEERMFEELEERARMAKTPTMPAPSFECVRQCPCGVRYDAEGWSKLAIVGPQDDGEGGWLLLRNCAFCRSSICLGGK